MACNGSGCQSGSCYKDEDATSNQPIKSEETDSTNPTNVCIKCKLNDAVSGYGGIDDGRFCADCFKTNLFGKFRFAVTSNAMITPTDKVLVAFSGGPSSRVALQFVHDMQERAQRNFDASRDRSLPVFGVGVVFLDESAVLSIPSSEMEETVEVIREVVSCLASPWKELHIVPIETVYSSDSGDGKERLIKVMNTVTDPTGREDMLLCMRMLALQKVASECGYNRIVLGSCISRIACHVISAAVKDTMPSHKERAMVAASTRGVKRIDNKAIAKAYRHHFHCHCKGSLLSFPVRLQYIQRVELHHFQCFQGLTASLPVHSMGQGYSLPADIQYVDARSEVPVVLPLRDCFAQEINMLCHLDGLKTVKLSTGPCSSINRLVSSFVSLLQEENPSRESTIVRTAGKLTPFQFNRIPEIIDGNVPLATRRRQKRYNLKSNESVSSESFCPLCNSPLNKSEIVDWSNMDSHRNSDSFYNTCCSSCQFQILPSDSTSIEQFYMDLPQPMVSRAKQASHGNLSLLREQIQDFLLSDGEDEK
ncbi:hypothetical protein LR48_Vigan03g215300 [Vigna angularis]|uniref:Cytoplasmic tRNA 2-thiolation protein 2 n=1 Tax=Phaseolus angularis TaxID=3914 RepID=A0A0L9U7R6_PHAAN|nr:hypothetical protein LR48_Vigan03g215300 [Vigna angularis]